MAEVKRSEAANIWRLGVSERRVLLIVGDLLMAGIALAVALYFWASGIGTSNVGEVLQFLQLRPPGWFYFLPFFWILLLLETYDPHRASNWQQTRNSLIVAAALGMSIYVIFYFTSSPGSLPRRGVASFALTALMLTTLWRLFYIRFFTGPQFSRRAVLVGAGNTGQALLKVIEGIHPAPYQILGVLDDNPKKRQKKVEGHKVIGGSEKLPRLIKNWGISDVLVAISGRMEDNTFRVLIDAQEQGVEIIRMPVAYEELLDRVPINHLEADWTLRSFVDDARINRFYELGKRLLDIVGGLVGVAILAVLTPLLAIAILVDSGRPIIYHQTRAGKGGKPYDIIKFRTMRVDAEKNIGPQLTKEDDKRSTRVGRLLRKMHLDEWPQFINVLRGEMSLVGPRPERPELMRHFEKLIPFYRARLLAKPGITGWAQVNLGYAATLEDMSVKLEYDLYYIKRRGPILDFIIILRTIATIFGFRGR